MPISKNINNAKHLFLREAIYLVFPNIKEACKEILEITVEELLVHISQEEYSLKAIFGTTKLNKFTKKVCPEKGSLKFCTYIAAKLEFKWCPRCKEYKIFEDFARNRSKSLGLNAYCKTCHVETNATTQVARSAKYKAAKLSRTPKWVGLSELDEISTFYKNCPEGFHVDHIIPLQGEIVSGLHCMDNLQYLKAEENLQKNNKFLS